MARPPKPWYWKQRKTWMVYIQGVKHNLGPDKEEAFRQFHKLMSEPPTIPTDSAIAILDAYLDWTLQNRAKGTYDWYKGFLESFCKKVGTLRASQVKPLHVQEWIDDHGWGSSTRRAAITAVKRSFSWAVKQGYLDRSPVEHLEKPEAGRREQIVSATIYEKMLSLYQDSFRDMLVFAWETGARPQECTRAEERHFDESNSRLVFPKNEAKGKKAPRIIYLTDEALSIVRKQLNRLARTWDIT